MNTPVVLIIFNRPQKTERVFNIIRQVKPPKLLVIADGPRPDRPEDAEKCAAARAVIERVDWDCEVLKNYSEENLGCGLRPATGISWAFENVEEAIILEDDCIPDPTFFPFCDELLAKYRHDQRIMQISGNGFFPKGYHLDASYTFSRFTLTWGWATWRRAWQPYYDYEMQQWQEVKEKNLLKYVLNESFAVNSWSKNFQTVADGKVDCWDFQWSLACWLQSGLCIIPKSNLVTNIGYGSDATHTTSLETAFMAMPSEPMTFPLKHPNYVIQDLEMDSFLKEIFDFYPSFSKRLKKKVSKLLKLKS